MARVFAFFCLVVAFAGVQSTKDPEAEFRRLPKLFHLDDFEKCLVRKDGIYCLGVFDVYSDVQPNPIYDIIQEKSQDINLYNRSYIHRGYCLPTRCPSGEANTTARFERCVDAWAREHSLRTRLRTLHYCRAHGQPRPREPDTTDLPHRVLLYFVYFMLLMAVVGTVYDFYFAKKGSKNPFLMSFSIRINWNHLTTNYQDVDPRLKELEIFHLFRFLMGIGLVYCHVCILTTAIYQHNPRSMEKFLFSPHGFALGTSMANTMTFILIANFLTSYNLLLLSRKIDLSLKNLPRLVLKRVIRMYPVYILLNGFAATWWKSFGDGPLWPVMLANESEVCRKKFWVTAAFLQNFINKKELCLVQTWIMAVDVQLHLITLFVTLVLLKHRQHALKVLSVLLIAAIAWLTYQAFEQDLIPCYLYMTPEAFRNFFIGADSFFDLYIHPMNGVIAAIVGTMLAFIHMDHQERGIKLSRSKVLVFLHYITISVLNPSYYLSYVYYRHYDRWTQHLMVVVERLLYSFLSSFLIYSLINHKDILHRIASARGLRTLAKLSFSMSMCHWCINILMLTNRWTLHDSTVLGITTDVIAVYVMANIVAVPLTLLVEYPLQKVLDRLINQTGHRWFAPIKAKTE